MDAGPAPKRTVWRRSRRGVVIGDLSELHGLTSGVIELSHRLFWQPDRRVNLNNAALPQWMYETVLREAVTTEELRSWLDGPTLARVWHDLHTPRGIRDTWEIRFPLLRQAGSAHSLNVHNALLGCSGHGYGKHPALCLRFLAAFNVSELWAGRCDGGAASDRKELSQRLRKAAEAGASAGRVGDGQVRGPHVCRRASGEGS